MVHRFKWAGMPAYIDIAGGTAGFGSSLKCDFAPPPHDSRTIEYSAEMLDTFSVNLTNVCNLQCAYCAVSSGAFRSDAPHLCGGTLSDTVSFIDRRARRLPPTRGITVVLAGAEPLANRKGLRALVSTIRQRHGDRVAFQMPSNLTLLDEELAAFLVDNKVHVLASLDGPEEIHDRSRRTKRGLGSYAGTTRGARMLLERDATLVTARPTITQEDEMLDVLQHLVDMGFSRVLFGMDYKNVAHRLRREAVVVQFGAIADYLWRRSPADSPVSFVQLEMILTKVLTQGLSNDWAHNMYCGAGLSMVNVDTDGYLYPCCNFALADAPCGYALGHVNKGLDEAGAKRFVQEGLRARTACDGCWMTFYCPGGCMYMHCVNPTHWREGQCGMAHLPLREMVELSFFCLARYQSEDRLRFAQTFTPNLVRHLSDLTQTAVDKECETTGEKRMNSEQIATGDN